MAGVTYVVGGVEVDPHGRRADGEGTAPLTSPSAAQAALHMTTPDVAPPSPGELAAAIDPNLDYNDPEAVAKAQAEARERIIKERRVAAGLEPAPAAPKAPSKKADEGNS